MHRKLVLEFTKMNGAGNDFIVVDNRFYHFTDQELSDLARRLCPRRFSVGADGVLAFSHSREKEYDYRMIYYNADGSRGTMCGNGARCLARFAYDAGIVRDELRFESDAGVYRAVVQGASGDRVKLFVQPPKDYHPDFKLEGSVPPGASEAYYIWPGVEHLVLFVDRVEDYPVSEWGPPLRRDPALGAAGANVNFVEVGGDSAAHLVVRTFEKGVEAETLACGTGAMAAALVARLTGRVVETPVDVQMPGGLLRVGFDLVGDAVEGLYLEGPVQSVYRGTVYV